MRQTATAPDGVGYVIWATEGGYAVLSEDGIVVGGLQAIDGWNATHKRPADARAHALSRSRERCGVERLIWSTYPS